MKRVSVHTERVSCISSTFKSPDVTTCLPWAQSLPSANWSLKSKCQKYISNIFLSRSRRGFWHLTPPGCEWNPSRSSEASVELSWTTKVMESYLVRFRITTNLFIFVPPNNQGPVPSSYLVPVQYYPAGSYQRCDYKRKSKCSSQETLFLSTPGEAGVCWTKSSRPTPLRWWGWQHLPTILATFLLLVKLSHPTSRTTSTTGWDPMWTPCWAETTLSTGPSAGPGLTSPGRPDTVSRGQTLLTL